MSFRFVGTALTILSTSGASTLYFVNGMPATAPHGATVVVPVTRAETPPDLRIKAVVSANDAWRPRIWVGTGATVNPVTGAPLSREEQESGWVDAPDVFAREIVRTVPDAATGAPKMVHEPNPEVMVLKPGEKAPAWVRGSQVAIAPGVEIDEPAPPLPAPASMAAPAPSEARAGSEGAARAEAHARTAGHARTDPHPRTETHARAGAGAKAEAGAKMEAGAKTETGYRIHLESYRDGHQIGPAWSALQKANPTVLGSLQPSLVTIEVPKKGKFLRLMAGSFESKEAAGKACAAIRKAHGNQYCRPLPPGRETT